MKFGTWNSFSHFAPRTNSTMRILCVCRCIHEATIITAYNHKWITFNQTNMSSSLCVVLITLNQIRRFHRHSSIKKSLHYLCHVLPIPLVCDVLNCVAQNVSFVTIWRCVMVKVVFFVVVVPISCLCIFHVYHLNRFEWKRPPARANTHNNCWKCETTSWSTQKYEHCMKKKQTEKWCDQRVEKLHLSLSRTPSRLKTQSWFTHCHLFDLYHK